MRYVNVHIFLKLAIIKIGLYCHWVGISTQRNYIPVHPRKNIQKQTNIVGHGSTVPVRTPKLNMVIPFKCISWFILHNRQFLHSKNVYIKLCLQNWFWVHLTFGLTFALETFFLIIDWFLSNNFQAIQLDFGSSGTFFTWFTVFSLLHFTHIAMD